MSDKEKVKVVAELLKPRVEVVGYYPDSPFKLGDILHKDYATSWLTKESHEIYTLDASYLHAIKADEVDNSPLIFKPLPWYAKRSVEEMPEYVRYPSGMVIRAAWQWSEQEKCYLARWAYANGVIEPATLEDYTNFINSKNK